MEKTIIEAANKYKELAEMLGDFWVERRIDETMPAKVESALLKLYYVKTLEARLEKCQEFLDEESDEETVAAIEDASSAIEQAAEDAFLTIDAYAEEDREFGETIEDLSVDSKTDDLMGHLYKLYKCEGIIRMAYRCAANIPIFGFQTDQADLTPDNTVMTDPEKHIMREMDIDIFKLI